MPSSSIRALGVRDPRGYRYAEVDLDALLLDSENPRIPIQESSLETLLAVLREDADGLFNLAKDIVRLKGTNPAELLNVREENGFFIVKEGNRRVAAQKLLRNPEQLRGHVPDGEVNRWVRLSRDEAARRLPSTALVVIGNDHEAWIDRRHLGPQSGVGVVPWDPAAKARRAARKLGVKDKAIALLDGLKALDAGRFAPLEPPRRTFTTFTRVLDSQQARAHIGIDTDPEGNTVLTRGEHSLKLLEGVLLDLRKTGAEKLTSRRIHTTGQIIQYLDDVEKRIGYSGDESPVTLSGSASPAPSPKPRPPRPPDILRDLIVPAAPRPRKILDELRKARRRDLPNAAIVLTRVLLELSLDQYAVQHGLSFAGDKDSVVEQEVKTFLGEIAKAGIKPTKAIKDALKFAASRPLSLAQKLEIVIRDLMKANAIGAKEGNAKIRELAAADIVPLLNDAVHRLSIVPSIARVDHILEVVMPVLNAMEGR